MGNISYASLYDIWADAQHRASRHLNAFVARAFSLPLRSTVPSGTGDAAVQRSCYALSRFML